MPDPKSLNVGDRIRFVSLPDEWQAPGYTVLDEDVEFMKTLIARGRPSRVYEIDEYGTPWIAARIHVDGQSEDHYWGIFERTGWRLVRRPT